MADAASKAPEATGTYDTTEYAEELRAARGNHDLENVGTTTLRFVTVEFRDGR